MDKFVESFGELERSNSELSTNRDLYQDEATDIRDEFQSDMEALNSLSIVGDGPKRAVSKMGIKCFSRFLLVANGRKPSKPHFHEPIRRRISEEDRRNV